ncbi:MAG: LamG domain-containing protein [Dehalococcoidia bacterium]|jgi:hypothetical protein
MKTLHADLTAAQKAATRRPAVSVKAIDKLGGVSRLRWDSLLLYDAIPGDWYNAAWRNRIKVTLASASLADFPSLITANQMTPTFWLCVMSTGADIVACAADGVTKLKRELVPGSFDVAAQTMELYVKTPLNATTIYIYYNNPLGAETNDLDAWDANFATVNHLNDNPDNATTQDSTTNNRDGVKGGAATPEEVAGAFTGSKAQDFDGGNEYISVGAAGDFNFPTGDFTWSGLVYRDNLSALHILVDSGASNVNGYRIWMQTNGLLYIQTFQAGAADAAQSTAVFAAGAWMHWAITRTGTTYHFYKNGQDVTSDGTAANPVTAPTKVTILGRSSASLTGKMDEVRCSASVRSAAWLLAEYNSLLNNAAFATGADDGCITPGFGEANEVVTCITSDGVLIRAVSLCDEETPIQISRCTNPPTGLHDAIWYSLPGCPTKPFGIGIACYGQHVFIFYGDGDDFTPYVIESTDSGTTWGAPAAFAAGAGFFGGDMDHYAAAFEDADNAVLITLDTDAEPWLATWDSVGGWSAITNISATLGGLTSMNSVAVRYNATIAKYEVFLSRGEWMRIYTYDRTTDTWDADYITLFAASTAAKVYHISTAPLFYAWSRDLPSFNYSTVLLCRQLYDDTHPTDLTVEPNPVFATSSGFNAIFQLVTDGAGKHYFITPGTVRYAVEGSELDLSACVLRCKASHAATGKAVLLLDNADGTISTSLLRGMRLTIQYGMNTASGIRYSDAQTEYYITNVKHKVTRNRRTAEVTACNAWLLLSAYAASEPIVWAATATYANIIKAVLARAGLKITEPSAGGDLYDTYAAAYELNAGQTGEDVVSYLLNRITELLRMEPLGIAHLLTNTSTDAAVYTYGTDHNVIDCLPQAQSEKVNHIRVTGPGEKFAETFDADEAESMNSRHTIIEESTLDTVAKLKELADARLRKVNIHTPREKVTVPMNCGQELYDVVSITHAATGLSAALRRVIDFEQELDFEKGIYNTTIITGDV